MIGLVLNFPYGFVGLLVVLVSIPQKASFNRSPLAAIFRVRSFWWAMGYMKNARAVAIGNVVILGPRTEAKDLEHELIHVRQYGQYPLIFPLLYYFELFTKGYRKNRFEEEAYSKAGNSYYGE